MSILASSKFLAPIVGTVLLAGSAAAPFQLQPESRLWVEGTSTVRSFSCQATDLRGNVAAAAGATSLAIADIEESVAGAAIVASVNGLDCGNGTMNGHLRRALKAPEHPTITFNLTDHRVTGSGSEADVTMTGRLRIAGQEKPVTIQADAIQEENGGLRVRGSKQLAMTEFGVTPPSLMMGTMKVGDRVTVKFDVLLRR